MIDKLTPEPGTDATATSPAAMNSLKGMLQKAPWLALAKWWLVGMAFLVIGTGALWVAKEPLGMPLWLATIASAEFTLLIRFFINDAWVFGHKRPTWKRLWQFHVAGAGGSAIWWVIANGLPRFGVQYLLASVAGSAVSMCFSILTNFLWIWRTGEKGKAKGVAT
jgi:putative flippase GtrA